MRIRKSTRWSILSFAALAACTAPVPEPEPRAPEPVSEAPLSFPGKTRFELSPEDSEIRVLVYRGGRLARLGHNHVITIREIEGEVWLGDSLAESAVRIRFPVAALAVDEPEARAQAGDDFPGEIPDRDIEGTRKNMLGEGLLDGERHPFIEAVSQSIEGAAGDARLRFTIEVRGQPYEVVLPASVDISGDRISASGQSTLTHDSIGIEPFSVMLGALAVQNELQLQYEFVARRTGH